jgi:endonuclease/exonuclease/phosphatase family metal-dependent hydrolase
MAQGRPITWLLIFAWIATVGAVVLLWTIARLLRPREEEFIAMLVVALVGGACIFCNGVFCIRGQIKTVPIANIAFGMATWAAIAAFVFAVLSNDCSEIPSIGAAARPAAPVNKIRIFDLNVLHGYPDFFAHEERFRKALDEIRSHGPDVLVLQEVWDTTDHGNMAERLGKELGFNHVYARANGSQSLIGFEEGAAVLSRFPILEAKRILLQPRKPWWENRIALVAKLDIGGEHVTIAGVHLSVLFPDDQADHLMEIAPQFALDIIVGDLNAESGSRAVAAFGKNGFTEAMPNSTIHAKGNIQWSLKEWNKQAIDHGFLSREFLKRWNVKETTCIVTSHIKFPCQPPNIERYAISDHDAILIDLVRR